MEADKTASGSFSLAGFCISHPELSGSSVTVIV
jgi:hypothetical protein